MNKINLRLTTFGEIVEQYFLRLGEQEQILFAKRLSVLISANVPIFQALQMLRSQANSKASAHIMDKIITEVENGQFLSSAMSQFPGVFGDFAINIVRIGEISGSLGSNLAYLSEELKKKRELKKKIISALIYPGLIVTATLGIAGLLSVYVLPKILPIFQTFKAQLPWTTRVLIFISNIVFHQWLYILLSVVAMVICFLVLSRLPGYKRILDRLILRLPLLGKMFKSYYLANFCRTLGLLLQSGVRLEESTKITAASMTNSAYKKELDVISESVTKGESLSQHIGLRPQLFPGLLGQMLAVGETAGDLSGSLLYLASLYEEELSDLTKNLATAIEPALMIFLGLVVGFVAISIITPIYGITQNLHP